MTMFGAGRQLKVTLVGDSKSLERALGRSESRLQRFGKRLAIADRASTSAKGGVMSFLTSGRGAALATGAGATVYALKSVTDAAARAEVVLGQTSVAVQDAGLSWQNNSKEIQDAAARISKSSAFDDEAVMQSFSVFVRGQKNVAKSIKLSALAADVARGRYIDLDSATQLVNKAAMGQVGALRRAGIQIDKNATSTEALAALQKAYGGAAVKYGNTAAGAQDRLRVSFENLQESVGSGVLPVLTETTNILANITDEAHLAAKALKALGVRSSDVSKAIKAAILATPGFGIIAGEAAAVKKIFGNGGKTTPSASAAGTSVIGKHPDEGTRGPTRTTQSVTTIHTVNVYANDPRQLTEAINKAAKRNTVQARGRLSPTTLVH